MTTVFLLTLNSLCLLWFLDRPFFVTARQAAGLTLCLLMPLLVSRWLTAFWLLLCLLLQALLKAWLIGRRFGSSVIPIFSFLKNFTLLAGIWFFSFDFWRLTVSLNFFSSPVRLFFLALGQVCLLALTSAALQRLARRIQLDQLLAKLPVTSVGFSWAALGLFSLSTFFHYRYFYPQAVSAFIWGLLLLTVLGVFFCCLLLLSAMLKQELQREELLQTSLANVSRQYRQLDGFKHDYKNILISTRRHLETADLPAAQNYLQTIIDYSQPLLQEDCWQQLQNLPHLPLQSLLLQSCQQQTATKGGFRLSIQPHAYPHSENMVDLVRCLAILLDNAHEAAAQGAQSQIEVSFSADDRQITWIIKNTFKRRPSLTALFQKGVTTKKNHSGIGLATLTEISSSYPTMDYHAAIDEQFFHITLTFTL